MPDDATTRKPDPCSDADWRRILAGKFVVLDGPDGSGKSTQMQRLVTLCRQRGVPCTDVREPGGTPVGEAVREILLHRHDADIAPRTEMLLYMASRAELVQRRIRPALQEGSFVLADRYVSSTLAYQGAAGGLPERDILDVARVATGKLKPHLIVIFDVDQQTAFARMGHSLDRMEAKGAAFHAKVREAYLAQARAHPHLFLVIDARADEETVWTALLDGLRDRLAP